MVKKFPSYQWVPGHDCWDLATEKVLSTQNPVHVTSLEFHSPPSGWLCRTKSARIPSYSLEPKARALGVMVPSVSLTVSANLLISGLQMVLQEPSEPQATLALNFNHSDLTLGLYIGLKQNIVFKESISLYEILKNFECCSRWQKSHCHLGNLPPAFDERCVSPFLWGIW